MTRPDEYSSLRPQWYIPDIEKVAVTHKPVETFVDRLAYTAVKACRCSFDTFSLYRFGPVTEAKVLTRCLFLETVAGVPGMVASMLRHMTSLRRMERDKEWINTPLNEAENERMHLMTFIEMRQTGYLMRFTILMVQGVMFNFLFCAYIVSPRFVHRFVGYHEEEAVVTYSGILSAIDSGRLRNLQTAVPEVAKMYWGLRREATFRDLINVIRADEAEHRVVNHTFADMHERHLQHKANPFLMQKSDSVKVSLEGTTGATAASVSFARLAEKKKTIDVHEHTLSEVSGKTSSRYDPWTHHCGEFQGSVCKPLELRGAKCRFCC